jgi:hypothetical protein
MGSGDCAMKEKGILICVCSEVIDKNTCLNECPKGKATKPDMMVEWPNWKKSVESFKK